MQTASKEQQDKVETLESIVRMLEVKSRNAQDQSTACFSLVYVLNIAFAAFANTNGMLCFV